jgi:hypothetical protein
MTVSWNFFPIAEGIVFVNVLTVLLTLQSVNKSTYSHFVNVSLPLLYLL